MPTCYPSKSRENVNNGAHWFLQFWIASSAPREFSQFPKLLCSVSFSCLLCRSYSIGSWLSLRRNCPKYRCFWGGDELSILSCHFLMFGKSFPITRSLPCPLVSLFPFAFNCLNYLKFIWWIMDPFAWKVCDTYLTFTRFLFILRFVSQLTDLFIYLFCFVCLFRILTQGHFLDFRERGRERNIDAREKHWLAASCMHLDLGLNTQPWYVPRYVNWTHNLLGTGWHSIWTTLAWADLFI